MRVFTWTAKRLLSFLALLIGTLLIFSLPAMLTPSAVNRQGVPMAYRWTPGKWLHVVWFHLFHLSHGQILPPLDSDTQQRFWSRVAAEWLPAVLTTLHLVAWALVASLCFGILAGWVMSRSGVRWMRAPAGAVTNVLQSLPDLIVATGFDLGLVLFGRKLGYSWAAPDLVFWQHFLAPVLAMTLLVAPYVARITSGVVDDVKGQAYVRTALAKGLSRRKVIFKHVGKNVLIQVFSVLPVVAGLLLSEVIIVEYFMDIRGAGWQLVVAIINLVWFTEPYIVVLYLFPFVVAYAVFAAASDLALHLMDPRLGQVDLRTRVALPVWPRASALLQALKSAISDVGRCLQEWRLSLPERLQTWRRALKDPVLLLGLLMVLALILIAVFARSLAPYDPNRRFPAYQAADGRIWAPPYGPSPGHLLGVDDLGRDILSRVIVGTRYALLFAAAVVPVKLILALALGWLAASRAGLWSRLLDWFSTLLTAIPQILVPLTLIRVFNVALEVKPTGAVLAGVLLVALPGVPRLAASFRQQFRGVLVQPFLEGAIAAGASPGRILSAHVLPQLTSQLISMMVMEIPVTMTLTATLAYFKTSPGGWITFDEGIGGPVIPEWGSMMENPLVLIFSNRWWLWTPFLALCTAVAAFSLLGEGLRRTSRTSNEFRWS